MRETARIFSSGFWPSDSETCCPQRSCSTLQDIGIELRKTDSKAFIVFSANAPRAEISILMVRPGCLIAVCILDTMLVIDLFSKTETLIFLWARCKAAMSPVRPAPMIAICDMFNPADSLNHQAYGIAI